MKAFYWECTGKFQAELEELWKRLVPMEGKALTMAGEVLRAMVALYRRWYNDGDRLEPCLEGELEGKTAHRAFCYLYQFEDPNSGFSTRDLMEAVVEARTEENYEQALENALDAILEWAASQKDLPNEDDYLDGKFLRAYQFEFCQEKKTDDEDDC